MAAVFKLSLIKDGLQLQRVVCDGRLVLARADAANMLAWSLAFSCRLCFEQ